MKMVPRACVCGESGVTNNTETRFTESLFYFKTFVGAKNLPGLHLLSCTAFFPVQLPLELCPDR